MSRGENEKCDLSKSALFQSAKIIVQNTVKVLTIQEIYIIIKLYNFRERTRHPMLFGVKSVHT